MDASINSLINQYNYNFDIDTGIPYTTGAQPTMCFILHESRVDATDSAMFTVSTLSSFSFLYSWFSKAIEYLYRQNQEKDNTMRLKNKFTRSTPDDLILSTYLSISTSVTSHKLLTTHGAPAQI